MTSEIELDDLSNRAEQSSIDINTQTHTDDVKDSALSLWAWTSSSLLALFSLCLALFPRFLLFASETSGSTEGRATLTPLESFLALHFGIWMSALALTLILNQSSPSHPLLVPVTMASLLTSWLSYNAKNIGSLASITFTASGAIGLWGLWAIVFAGASRISKKTGADKHTSSFLFGNKNAASVQKKNWKKEQKGRHA